MALIRETAKALEEKGKRVTGPALAAALGVSERSGYRYMKSLQTA
jgi:predicted DNA-binding transcriptional regulator YafY